ncbi:mitochondrial D-glutamate cyclase Dgc1 [Schizosaccharomyces osmophilus]|uniref:Mitochondrial D-glutamate cyclase Dgc1 n=1 Tax=Schizosaccharomyces osmophilus TaxID=2545709 RepID=A0AAE9WE16_9SCHI|nr:mitochondrial D-glutamate cyclase Dgc1 [Schizosaccharomyces osmophilus]WBW74173.1 mitochondrial D-glutamate cyclase Dgc1 [Schizosaccharomyces osmophilus]
MNEVLGISSVQQSLSVIQNEKQNFHTTNVPSYKTRSQFSPNDIRKLIRNRQFTVSTTGWADGYVQANLLVLPTKYADDFRNLCLRNPVPCPLLGETAAGNPTEFSSSSLAANANLATDIPFYCEYIDGKFSKELTCISSQWNSSYVGFLIGCSFSFEAALVAANLVPRHLPSGNPPPMFKTNLRLCPSGVFSGTFVVSMRPYKEKDIPLVRRITAAYTNCHGEPVAWGWDGAKQLGIENVMLPDYGFPVQLQKDEVPVFWGCGVTPQNVVMMSNLTEPVYSHKPGYMFLTDLQHGF